MTCPSLQAVSIRHQSEFPGTTAKSSTIEDWKYMAEGGEHVIFEYRPSGNASKLKNSDDEKWDGLVLRIRKASIMENASVAPHASDHEHENEGAYELERQPLHEEEAKNVNLFISFAQVRLKEYFDTAETVYIEPRCIDRLRDQALRSGEIPPSRKADWQLSPQQPVRHHALHFGTGPAIDVASSYGAKHPMAMRRKRVRATLHANYFRIPSSPSLTDESAASLSVEIKPKAGYLAYSPLVHPLRRAKYRHTRFEILQHLHHSELVSKGWICDRDTLAAKSRYSPLDLFSTDAARMRAALVQLFASPQNNLRVMYSNNMLYGWNHSRGKNCVSEDGRNHLHAEALRKLFRIGGDKPVDGTRERLATEIQEIMVAILQTEPLLQTLRGLQKTWDNLDGDGAVFVFRRLVEMLGGSEDQAEAVLESYTPASTDVGSWFSAYGTYEDSTLKEWNRFIQLIKSNKQNNGQDDDDVYDLNYQRAIELVNKFSIVTCCYLLQQWLASAALCDLSFILTICRADNSQEHKRLNKNDENIKTITGVNGCIWHYRIKIIDCDPKPVAKLRQRDRKESVMQHFRTDQS